MIIIVIIMIITIIFLVIIVIIVVIMVIIYQGVEGAGPSWAALPCWGPSLAAT